MQVKRLGKYKTGDIILRKDMSDEEREVYTSLLDGIHSHFVTTVAKVLLTPYASHACINGRAQCTTHWTRAF